ncbi:MAG: YbhB/YbcL family Raf kinase inhibitor-like protein [Myxococcota bacterium]|nr:YbhB/YbcL family Raf kinase inhibitor-like protein [Myxococcota bacterium]
MQHAPWIVCVMILFCGCQEEEDAYPVFTVSSPAFSSGATIPRRHTCDGDNVSPPLIFTDVPENVATFAIVLDDPDASLGTFAHWLIWGISKDTMFLGEGFGADLILDQDPDLQEGVRQGTNDIGSVGYYGPCPSDNDEHRYVFTAYALSEDLSLKPRYVSSAAALISAMEGKILGVGKLEGFYK